MIGEKNINTLNTQIESFNGQLVELNQKRTNLITNIDQTKASIKSLNGDLKGAQDKQKTLEGTIFIKFICNIFLIWKYFLFRPTSRS
jgi:chromosome segregation ATPase